MKRSKRIIVLVAILAVLCVATFALTKYEEKKEEIQNSDEVILEISREDVESLTWKYEEESFAFYRDENQWKYEKDEKFPVSEEKINEILTHFESFGVSFVIENVEDYSQYGLKAPECELELTTSEDTYDLKIGTFSKMDAQRYVEIGDGNVYLVSEDPMDYLEISLSDMILNDEIPELEEISEIQFAGAEEYRILYEEESTNTYSDEDVYFVKKNGNFLPLDTDTVEAYLDTITSLSLQDYVTYNASEEELESCGLNDPELSVSITYAYEEDNEMVEDTLVLSISRNPEEVKAAEEAESKDEDEIPEVTKYVRIGDSQIVYRLSDTAYDTLAAASYNDLRHKELMWADFEQITQIDVTLEEETHVITSRMDEEDGQIWYYGDVEISISDFESAWNELTASDFTSEEAKQKEEISLVVSLENENFPQVKVQLYRYDGSYCLAVVDGESVALVERSAVMKLVESVQTIVLN